MKFSKVEKKINWFNLTQVPSLVKRLLTSLPYLFWTPLSHVFTPEPEESSFSGWEFRDKVYYLPSTDEGLGGISRIAKQLAKHKRHAFEMHTWPPWGRQQPPGRLRMSAWCFCPAFGSIQWLLHVLASSLLNVTDFLWFFLIWSLAPLFPGPTPPLSWYPQRLTMCLVCCQHLNPNMMPSESHLLSVSFTTEHPPSYLCIWHVNVPLMHLFLKDFHKGGNISAFGSH